MASKKRKIEDENREFKNDWTDCFAFIQSSRGLPSCLICNEELANNKKSNLERHFHRKHNAFAEKYPAGDTRKKAVEELKLKAAQSQSIFTKWVKSSSSTTAASFVVSHEIIKRGKPFTDGEYMKHCFITASEHLFSDFKNKDEIFKKIKEMPLSAKTVRDRTLKLAKDITGKQIEDINSAPSFSIACDESCDVDDIAQVALLGRYVNSEGPQEELVDLLPLTGQTRGEDIFAAIITCLKAKEIQTSHIISVATDGAPSMTGTHKGFVSLLKEELGHDVISFHCIIHQEALCAQSFPPEFTEVMNLVVKIVNKIMGKGLNHRQFRELLEEVDCQYSDLLLHNKVRWLSRGRVLERFAACLEEVKKFLHEKGHEYPELTTPEWLQKFYFMVDITSHLNDLNRKLQGKGNTALLLLEEVLSFERKFALFVRDLEKSELVHFPSLKKYREATDYELDIDSLKNALLKMEKSFEGRFQEFRREKATLSFVIKPLEADTSALNFSAFTGVSRAELELELADLQEKDMWTSKFTRLLSELENLEKQQATLAHQHRWTELLDLKKQDQIVFEVWNALPDTYRNMKRYAFGILSIFGSTYLCEQVFSSMNFIKSKLRSRLNDESLQSCLKLKTTAYSPNIEQLSKETQEQKSH